MKCVKSKNSTITSDNLDAAFEEFVSDLEMHDPRADYGEYTLAELRIMYAAHLKKQEEERTKNIIRKSNITKILKYISAWHMQWHKESFNYNGSGREYYTITDRPALAEHKFYIVDSYPDILRDYRDIIDKYERHVADVFKSLVNDIDFGLWHVDLRDREVRTILNYLKPLLGYDVVQAIIDNRKPVEKTSEEELGESLQEAADNLLDVSNELFGGDDDE